jgi:hypothetical protein
MEKEVGNRWNNTRNGYKRPPHLSVVLLEQKWMNFLSNNIFQQIIIHGS